MVGALESGCPLVCSRNALQSLQLADLSKAPAVDISVSPGVPRDICLFFEQPLTG